MLNSEGICGTIRYELTGLLGEHMFEGLPYLFSANAHVNTPFGFYTVAEARVVVEGTASAGKAHGDGVVREAQEFILQPRVGIWPSFPRTIDLDIGATTEQIRFDKTYSYPFAPEVTPQPRVDGYPPLSFDVALSIFPSIDTKYPAFLEPQTDHTTFYPGIVFDEPIVANIERAYVLLAGPSIVPEPMALHLLCGGVVAFVLLRRVRS
jgi:hypothetical protein